MTPKNFVSGLRIAVVEENVNIYRDLFTATLIEDSTDPYWKRALTLFNTLSQEQREVFFEIVRQVTIDTTSNVLGVIDGVNVLEGDDSEFELKSGTQQISGDLQALFLAEVE